MEDSVEVKLVRLEGKVDLQNSKIDALQKSFDKFSEHYDESKRVTNERLGTLEKSEAKLIGIGLVIIFLSSLITAGIVGLIKNFMK